MSSDKLLFNDKSLKKLMVTIKSEKLKALQKKRNDIGDASESRGLES